MTQSARQARQRGHIPKRGRGKGRADGEGSSQATQAAKSQVVDPMQVECLNYQDKIHDAHDGGYDRLGSAGRRGHMADGAWLYSMIH